MKYKIVSYDDYLKIVNAKVAEDEYDINLARIFPVSIRGITSQEQLEDLLFTVYKQSLTPTQVADYSTIVEDYAQNNIDEVITMSVPTPILTVQLPESDSLYDATTSTNDIRIL